MRGIGSEGGREGGRGKQTLNAEAVAGFRADRRPRRLLPGTRTPHSRERLIYENQDGEITMRLLSKMSPTQRGRKKLCVEINMLEACGVVCHEG